MDLDKIIYLLQGTLIGKHYYYESDIVEVECSERAKILQGKGVGLVVADAPEFARYCRDLKKKNEEPCFEFEQFLNRVRSFPIGWRTDEWRALVEEIDAIYPSPLTKKETTKPKRTRKKKVEE